MKAALNERAVPAQLQIGPTSMFSPRHYLMAWIGVGSGFIAVLIYNLLPSNEMLPINRTLFATVATLLMV